MYEFYKTFKNAIRCETVTDKNIMYKVFCRRNNVLIFSIFYFVLKN